MRATWRSLGWFVVVSAIAACGGNSSPDAADSNVNETASDGADQTSDSPVDVPADEGLDVPTDVPVDAPAPTARTTVTNGSSVAFSANDQIAVVANRFAGSVAVFSVNLTATPPTLNRTALLSTGAGSEPWAVVIGNDNDTAYVVLRGTRQVVRITNLDRKSVV